MLGFLGDGTGGASLDERPKALKRSVDCFPGEGVLPYGTALCLRPLMTVPSRFKPPPIPPCRFSWVAVFV